MTCDELRSTCKKMGRKQAGTKAGRFETCCEAGVGHGGPTISKKGKAQWVKIAHDPCLSGCKTLNSPNKIVSDQISVCDFNLD